MEKKIEKKTLLSVKNLVVEYTSDNEVIHAVNDISFSLEKGKVLGLVGETGAGKTTIAKAILRILPDPPAKIKSGEILYNGEDILKMRKADMREIRGKEISMVFQDPMTALNPVMRVGDQIAEVIRIHDKVSKKDSVKKAVDMLKMVGIPENRYREYPHQFSGGMKQRVVIAIALACSPNLLLADEPTTALDVTIQAQVLNMIKQLNQKKDTSMILITHDLGVVAGMCDYVAVVYAGQIIEYGTKREIFKNSMHPYTKGLFAALPDIHSNVERLTPIKGVPPEPSNLPKGCFFAPRCPYADEACTKGTIDMKQLKGEHCCRCLHVNEKEGGIV